MTDRTAQESVIHHAGHAPGTPRGPAPTAAGALALKADERLTVKDAQLRAARQRPVVKAAYELDQDASARAALQGAPPQGSESRVAEPQPRAPTRPPADGAEGLSPSGDTSTSPVREHASDAGRGAASESRLGERADREVSSHRPGASGERKDQEAQRGGADAERSGQSERPGFSSTGETAAQSQGAPPPPASTAAGAKPAANAPTVPGQGVAAPAGRVTRSAGPEFAPPRGEASRHTKEDPTGLSAPGVRGQAMRGVFAMLRTGASGSSSAMLALAPESLGQMRINVSVRDGRVRAMFAVESAQAHRSLERSLPELRQAIESRGLIVESVGVERSARIGESASEMIEGGITRNPPGLAGDSREGSSGDGGNGPEAHDRPPGAGLPAAEGSVGVPGVESPGDDHDDIGSARGWRLGVDLTA
ncbi:MAG: flagellar hook-length control protein FliK [Phycisphaeraceae bacterium]|nr:flagellar hook-length control protein FliK [Phycisphaeraceae bacterium]